MAWYNINWSNRKEITITENAGENLNNYMTKMTVTYDADMKADFEDLRFTADDGTTLIDHWTESHIASTSAIVWVDVPTITASSTATIYMYYGNASASDTSNPTISASDTGIVSYYKCEEDAADTDVVDSAGNYDGVADVNTSNLSVVGKINDGFYVDGSEKIDLNAEIIPETGDFTLNVWAKCNDDTTGVGYIVSQSNDNVGRQRMSLRQNNAEWSAGTSESDLTNTFIAATTLPDDTVWQMITVTRTSGASGFTIRVNNETPVTAAWDGTDISGSNECWLGSRASPSGAQYYNGSFDEVGIWSRVLTNDEITGLYNSGNGWYHLFTNEPTSTFGSKEYNGDFNITTHKLTIGSGIIYTSPVIWQNSTPTKATMTVTVDSGSGTYELSADGGSNYETVTSGTQHTFTNADTSGIRYKITGVSYMTISKIEIEVVE